MKCQALFPDVYSRDEVSELVSGCGILESFELIG